MICTSIQVFVFKDCSTVCSVGTLNSDCDMCICDGTIITGRVVAESSGNPVSNAALYARAAPTSILTTSNSTGFFALESTCESTELLVTRDGFVDTVTVASEAYVEITMPKIGNITMIFIECYFQSISITAN